MKITANGKTITVPDGTSQEDIDLIVNEQFSSAPDEFVPNIKDQIPIPKSVPFGMDVSAIKDANKRIDESNEYQKSFIGNEERQRIKELESERPFLSGMVEGIKNVGQQFAAGTALSPDFLPESVQNVLDYQPFGENKPRGERESEIKENMARVKERYAITRGENPIATMAGEVIPYLATGLAGEKILLKAGKALEGPLKAGSIKANRMLGQTSEANRILNKPARLPTEYEQSLNTIARGAATGAAEGAAQYDTTAGEGALTATLGGFSGMFGPMRLLNKVRNERDAAGKAIIDKMHEEGFQITPGIRTGNKALQTEEAGIRNSDNYGQEFANQVDRPNQRRMTDMAGEAIGLNTKNRDLLSQDELAGHMQNLKGQYTDLERNTIGKYGLAQIRDVGGILKDLKPAKNRNTSAQDRARYDVVNSFAKQMKAEMGSPQRSPNGRFQGYQFDGSQYQNMRSAIQDSISQAYSSGDRRLGDNLRKMQKVLDDSLTQGMDKATSSQWKDLNERYGMTQMLLKNGLTPSGKVDATKLTSAVMNNDEAGRTLTGQGGRIKKFQDIARFNDVLHGSDVEGGSLTGLGTQQKAERGLMKRAYQYATRPVDLFGLSYRLNTNRMPFIGQRLSPAHGLSPTTSISLQRGIAQTETPQEYVSSEYDNLMREISGK
jgi:hypothetical protein